MVFPAGEINSIELHDSLSDNVNIEVFGASSIDRHGGYVFKNYRSNLPLISDLNFIDSFNSLIKEWNIEFIFPTHDTVAEFLSDNQKQIIAKVVTAEKHTAEICRSKKLTYQLFENEIFCPKVYETICQFSCFIKPDKGQGAVGTKVLLSNNDVPKDIDLKEYVVTEYLPGKELTVDCLTDKEGVLRAVLPRYRKRLMGGVSVAGESIEADKKIQHIAKTINKKLGFLGLWYFQLKEDSEGKYKLLEISTRCAGTMCLSRARGINLPLLSVYCAAGKSISIFENPYKVKVDWTLISRYCIDYEYDIVYIDYDDVIVSGNAIILSTIRFLYQCRNKGKKVVLLSRHNLYHEDSLLESLKSHCISENLFDKIISLSYAQEKTEFIIPQKAIFIDNAYVERKKFMMNAEYRYLTWKA